MTTTRPARDVITQDYVHLAFATIEHWLCPANAVDPDFLDSVLFDTVVRCQKAGGDGGVVARAAAGFQKAVNQEQYELLLVQLRGPAAVAP